MEGQLERRCSNCDERLTPTMATFSMWFDDDIVYGCSENNGALLGILTDGRFDQDGSLAHDLPVL